MTDPLPAPPSAPEGPERQDGTCMQMRLDTKLDVLVERTPTYTLVRCIGGMHDGQWIAWGTDHKLRHIGPEAFVRRKLEGR